MATMSHTEDQRAAWHAGKRKKNESLAGWFNRVIVRHRNYRGAYTPVGFRIAYKTLDK